jgi:hypothetical protein
MNTSMTLSRSDKAAQKGLGNLRIYLKDQRRTKFGPDKGQKTDEDGALMRTATLAG